MPPTSWGDFLFIQLILKFIPERNATIIRPEKALTKNRVKPPQKKATALSCGCWFN